MKRKDFLTVKEVANYLRIKPDAVTTRIRSGDFGAVTRTSERGSYRITVEQLEAYIEKNTGYSPRTINVTFGRRGRPRDAAKLG